jgi:acetyltransferase
MFPAIGLNATFAKEAPKAGNVAFLSQSGALLAAILDWSHREEVGFSAIVSTGSMLDVGWGDLIYHFGDDPRTKSILLYMESVGDARSFLSAAREVALTKPIIVIKAGRSQAASRAAASHTGALTGSDEVLEAAFRRSGVLRVHNIADLFYMAEVLGRQPRPKGPRLTILTNAGGPGVLATDSLVASGGELAELSPESLRRLDEFLPAHWSHNNPIDVLGDADPERYARALEIASQDPNSDGLLVILSPQGMTEPTQIAQRLKPYAKQTGKPVLASWMGGSSVAAGEAALNSAGIPTFPYPDTAARAFTYMWRYTYNLRGLYETPTQSGQSEIENAARNQVEQIIQNARSRSRTLLTELESKQLLSLYGIPTVETRVAASEDEAATLAAELRFPVVLKVFSETITHKTDVGGVKLNLPDEAAVRSAYRAIQSSVAEKAGPDQFSGVTVEPMVKREGYELILGSSVDPQFGPVVLFGSGGQLVEVYRDRALALPPLNTTLAQRMMEQTRIFTALKGVRGRKPVNMAALENVLVRFSQLVLDQRWISEIDINPLLASPERILALDARIVLHGPAVTLDQLPKPAIRPYPLQYVSSWTMKDGNSVTIRPIRPEDEPLMVKFHETLSDHSVYLRYFCTLSLSRRVAHERLLRICFGDYDREMALVAERTDPLTGERRIMAVGRLNKLHSRNEAEVAVLVSDQYQKLGLGNELLRRVLQIARDEKLSQVSAEMLPDNIGMQIIMKRFGFRIRTGEDPSSLQAYLDL